MKILFTGQSVVPFPMIPKRSTLQRLALDSNHVIVQKLADRPDIVICMDWKRSSGRLISQAKSLGVPMMLVKGEPSIVILEHLDSAIDSMFNKVIELGRPNTEPLVKYPINWNLDFFDNIERLDRVVAVSANKFSFVSGEMYSLRAEAYSKLDYLDLFGVGWERSFRQNVLKLAKELQIAVLASPRKLTSSCIGNLRIRPCNFLGPAEDKLETLSRYKVSLVIENSAEFMSEKLIDSILAGTIPVYVGPQVEIFGIPKELVVSAEPNILSIQAALAKAHGMPYKEWHIRAKKWILEPGVKESWASKHVIRLILETAELAIKR